jgi:hypothetical protein
MKSITESTKVEHYRKLVSEMTLAVEHQECEIDSKWALNCGWKVVPVQDANHFPVGQIARIVSALKNAGYSECVAVAREPVDPLPVCFSLSITEGDFRNFNAECGSHWYLLTPEDRSWAISCNDLYILFGGKQELVEAMLGKSIEQVRQDFLDFVSFSLGQENPDYPPLQAAKRYAAL